MSDGLTSDVGLLLNLVHHRKHTPTQPNHSTITTAPHSDQSRTKRQRRAPYQPWAKPKVRNPKQTPRAESPLHNLRGGGCFTLRSTRPKTRHPERSRSQPHRDLRSRRTPRDPTQPQSHEPSRHYFPPSLLPLLLGTPRLQPWASQAAKYTGLQPLGYAFLPRCTVISFSNPLTHPTQLTQGATPKQTKAPPPSQTISGPLSLILRRLCGHAI
jgi:hypothetical protein